MFDCQGSNTVDGKCLSDMTYEDEANTCNMVAEQCDDHRERVDFTEKE